MFLQNCYQLFDGWAEDAYNKIIEKNKILHDLNCEIDRMKKQRDCLIETYDKLTKDILLSERQWDFLLRIQVTLSFINVKHNSNSLTHIHFQELLLHANGFVMAQ